MWESGIKRDGEVKLVETDDSAPTDEAPGPRQRMLRGDLREFVVIVLGILAAFAVDAWWTKLQESTDVRETLAAVESEFATSRDSLRITGDRFRSKAEAGQRLLQLTGPAAAPDVVAEATDLIGTVMRGAPSRVSTASLNMLFNAGHLAQIENRDLQRALSSWPERLDHLYQMEDAVLNTWLQEVRPRLVMSVPYVNLDIAVGFRDYPSLREEFTREVGGPSRFDADFVGLLRDLQVRKRHPHRDDTFHDRGASSGPQNSRGGADLGADSR